MTTPFDTELSELGAYLETLPESSMLHSKLNNLINQLSSLKGKSQDLELLSICTLTNKLLKNPTDTNIRQYQYHAKKTQGSPSLAMQVLGACMIALAVAIAIMSSGLLLSASVGLLGCGLFAIGRRQTGLSKSMEELSKGLTPSLDMNMKTPAPPQRLVHLDIKKQIEFYKSEYRKLSNAQPLYNEMNHKQKTEFQQKILPIYQHDLPQSHTNTTTNCQNISLWLREGDFISYLVNIENQIIKESLDPNTKEVLLYQPTRQANRTYIKDLWAKHNEMRTLNPIINNAQPSW